MISRKKIGRAARYATIPVFLPFLLLTGIMHYSAKGLELVSNKIFARLEYYAEWINAVLKKWEMNGPEGTMTRLRADYTNSKEE